MKLASIETVRNVRRHPNADRLDLTEILGWQTITKRGEFQPGDRCVFVVIDTILPPAPWSAFLADKKASDKPIRLRTVKLRGEFSQGLALPLSVLPEHVQGWQDGADVGGELGIKKYEKDIPAILSGEAKATFPTHIAPRTDEDNGLSHTDIVYSMRMEDIDVTLKLDGSSCTIIYNHAEGIVHVCSRNLSLVENEKNGFWRAARDLKFDKDAFFPGYDGNIILQGELMGPGVQGNQLELSKPTLYLYQLRTQHGGWFPYSQLMFHAETLGAKVVPLIVKMMAGDWTLDKLQHLADGQVLPNGKPAEGIVVRPTITQSGGHGRPLGFKIINRNYGE